MFPTQLAVFLQTENSAGDRKLRREDTKNGTIQSSSDFQSSWTRQSRKSYRFGEQSIKNPNFVSTKLLNNE